MADKGPEEIFPFVCGLCHKQYNKIHYFYKHFLAHDIDTSRCFHLCAEDKGDVSFAEMHPGQRNTDIPDKSETVEHSDSTLSKQTGKFDDKHDKTTEEESSKKADKTDNDAEKEINVSVTTEQLENNKRDHVSDKTSNDKNIDECNIIDNETNNTSACINNQGNDMQAINSSREITTDENIQIGELIKENHDPACEKDFHTENKNKSNPHINLYTCSICSYAFPTICSLHNHMSGCAHRGSYTYDHDSKVAYPYNRECSFMIPSTNDIDLETGANISKRSPKKVKKRQPTKQAGKERVVMLRQRRRRKPKILEDYVTTIKQEPGDTTSAMYIVNKGMVGRQYEDNDSSRMEEEYADTSDEDGESQKMAGKSDGRIKNASLPSNSKKRPRGRPRKPRENEDDFKQSSENKRQNNGGKLKRKNGGKNKKSMHRHDKKSSFPVIMKEDKLSDDSDQITIKPLSDSDSDTEVENIYNTDEKPRTKKMKKEARKGKTKSATVKVKIEKPEVRFSRQISRSEKYWGEGKKGNDIIACEICPKKFRRFRMDYHMISHSDTRKYCCPVCEKTFKYGGHLSEHERTHSEISPFICEICGQGHHRAMDLKHHMMRHRGERPSKCHICGLSFRSSNGLTRHLLIHSVWSRMVSKVKCRPAVSTRKTMVKELWNSNEGLTSEMSRLIDLLFQRIFDKKDFTCDQCGRSFKRKDFLTQHIRIHKKEKTHRCTTCDKSFYNNYQLTCHLMTHSGERPNTCPVCGNGYIQRKELRKHMKSRHNRVLEPTIKTNVKDYNAMIAGVHTDKTKLLIKEDVDYDLNTTPVRHFEKSHKHDKLSQQLSSVESEPQYIEFDYNTLKANIQHIENVKKQIEVMHSKEAEAEAMNGQYIMKADQVAMERKISDGPTMHAYRAENSDYGGVQATNQHNVPVPRSVEGQLQQTEVRSVEGQLQQTEVRDERQLQQQEIRGVRTQLQSQESAGVRVQLHPVGVHLQSQDNVEKQLQTQVTGYSIQMDSQVAGVATELDTPLELVPAEESVEIDYQGVGNEIQVYYGEYTEG